MANAKPTTKATKAQATPPPKQPSKAELWIGRIGHFIARTSIPEILLVATLAMARYITNSDFSYPSEIVLNIVLFAFIVTAVYYLYRFLLRSRLAAHIAGLLLSDLLFNFNSSFDSLRNFTEKLIPASATNFTHAMLKVLIIGIVFGLIGYGVNYLANRKELKDVPVLKFVIFVICFIFVVQLGKVGMRMWEIRKDLAYKLPTSAQLQKPSTTPTVNSQKPNVYYLLFDRYANDTTLKNIYNYDNSGLLNNLQSQGFAIRRDAYANYPFTMQSVSSTLGANYHTTLGKEFKNDAADFQTGFPYRAILNNSPVTQAFQTSGYQYNQVSSWWDFTRMNPSADTNPSKSFRLRAFGKNFWVTDLQRDIINKSVLSPLLLKGLTLGHTTVVQYQLDRNPTENFYAEESALQSIVSNAAKQTKPQFTFAHFLSPHDPYIFDAQGNTPTYDDDRTDQGVDEYVKYTNQVTYLNTQITQMVANIRTKDPTAAIVIQADEGPYPKQFRGTLSPGHYYDPITLPLAQERQKFGVLAAYYLPDGNGGNAGSTITASANTFRVVLNQYLGYQLPMLPDCQFSVGDKFKVFNYQLVSGALKGTAQPTECKQYQ